MAQLNPRSIKRDRAGFAGNPFDLTAGHKQKFRFAIHEARDQPRASHAVNMNV
jgi:hypothetical protein